MESFFEIGLRAELLNAMTGDGIVTPTEIQTAVIPLILAGTDVAGRAPTGTGKTLAFCLPLLNNINPSPQIEILVIAPTRELVLQIEQVMTGLTKYMKSIRTASVIGGEKYERQAEQFRRRPNILIGTPGRLLDHLKQKNLTLKDVKSVVLDEADLMLGMGFREDVLSILSYLPEERQTLLFSATMQESTLKFSRSVQKNPTFISVKHGNGDSIPDITQHYIITKDRGKLQALKGLLADCSFTKCIVFCATRLRCGQVASALKALNLPVDFLHGEMGQHLREAVVKRFRQGKFSVLIATDIAARGLDIAGMELVIHYDLPADKEFYLHRIGRTGRADKSGVSYALVREDQLYDIKELERFMGKPIIRAFDKGGDLIDNDWYDSVLSGGGGAFRAKIEQELANYNQTHGTAYDGLDFSAALMRLLFNAGAFPADSNAKRGAGGGYKKTARTANPANKSMKKDPQQAGQSGEQQASERPSINRTTQQAGKNNHKKGSGQPSTKEVPPQAGRENEKKDFEQPSIKKPKMQTERDNEKKGSIRPNVKKVPQQTEQGDEKKGLGFPPKRRR